ncbi:hypothetical protein [Agrobacterium bohemicum]|nr:hypothetical protein [Agrobacterium bohemicum]
MFAQFTRTILFAIMSFLALDRAEAGENTSCGDRAEVIVHNTYPDATKSDDETFQVGASTISINNSETGIDAPHMMTCRVWPANPHLTLVAVPLIKSANEDGTVGDLELLVVDTSSLAVKQRLLLANRMNDDAIAIRSLEFDTARYKLTKEQAAFGLRISASNNSRANPYNGVSLWLYVLEGSSIRPVVDGMVVSETTGESDTNCATEFKARQTTLSMAPTTNHGFADISAVETNTTTTNFVGKDRACDETSITDKPQKLRLIYDGRQYPIPEERRAVTE